MFVRKRREDIATPDVLAGADAWQHGEVLQLTLQPTMARSMRTRDPREATHDDSPIEPTRRLRTNKVRQLYARIPGPAVASAD